MEIRVEANLPFIDIIIFAVIAVLILRLRSVLGRATAMKSLRPTGKR